MPCGLRVCNRLRLRVLGLRTRSKVFRRQIFYERTYSAQPARFGYQRPLR